MLLLTSTNDRLQIITSSAATIDVHASWVDTSAGTITPGRTNTIINSATTTSVAGAPAASTQRNVKTLHVRNVHASLSCDITVQHTDGTVVSQLYKATLPPGSALEYTDQGGFGGGRMAAPTGGTPIRQVFTANGTYTPTAGMAYVEIECVGGGGGGGAVAAASGYFLQGGGGGSGGYSRKIVTAATIGASQAVTVGAGGAGGSAVSPANGGAGGDSSVGSLCIGKGGSGGSLASSSSVPLGGAGGIAGTGDIAAAGAPGGAGMYTGVGFVTVALCGVGGSSHFGGGGNSPSISGGNGPAGSNYGGGGAGGYEASGGAANRSGGNGSNGVVIITEYFR